MSERMRRIRRKGRRLEEARSSLREGKVSLGKEGRLSLGREIEEAEMVGILMCGMPTVGMLGILM